MTCAEDITIRKSTAGSETGKRGEGDAAGDYVGHVYVDSGEASEVEGEGHFSLTVDTLFTKDGHTRLVVEWRHQAGEDREAFVFGVVLDVPRNTWVGVFEDVGELLVGACCVVSEFLHVVRCVRPDLLNLSSGLAVDQFVLVVDGEVLLRLLRHTTNALDQTRWWSACSETRPELHLVGLSDLENSTEFFVEESLDGALNISCLL